MKVFNIMVCAIHPKIAMKKSEVIDKDGTKRIIRFCPKCFCTTGRIAEIPVTEKQLKELEKDKKIS